MSIDEAKDLKPKDEVFFAGSYYEFAELKEFTHGIMVGIYDEKPTLNLTRNPAIVWHMLLAVFLKSTNYV